MKKWSTYIFLLVAGALCLLATSCGQEDEGLEPVLVSNGKATVQFSIALGNSGAGSRANDTWGETYDPDGLDNGEPSFENKINLSQLHVNLTLSDGTPVTIKKIIQSGQNNNVYDYVGEVEVESVQSLTGAKIEVRANIAEGETTFTTDYENNQAKGVASIPMWGVHTVTETESLRLVAGPDPIVFAEPIYLLRSMAKVQVVFDKVAVPNDYKILGAYLNKYNKQGNLLPIAKDESGNIVQEQLANTKSYNREDCINPINSVPSDEPSLPFEVAEDGRSCVIYVPEYAVQYDEDGNSDLNIQLSIDTDKDGVSDSEEIVSKGNFPVNTNLVRNHWYVYNVKSVTIEDGVQFELYYQVIDWTEIDNGELTFGNANGNV